MFDAIAAVTPNRADIPEAFRREWVRLALPGAMLTGVQRVEAAGVVRAGQAGERPRAEHLEACLVTFVELLSADPAAMDESLVAGLGSDLGYATVVEAVGITSRLAAVDGFHRAMGIPLEDLPQPSDGNPTGEVHPTPTTGNGWVPKATPGSIVDALSLIPADASAQEDLHGPLYLTYEEMSDRRFVRGLNRAQLELIAARTSSINDCFY